MVLRFLARDGSRRLPRAAAQLWHAEARLSPRASISRSNHTVIEGGFVCKYPHGAELSAEKSSILVQRALIEANSEVGARASKLLGYSRTYENSLQVNFALSNLTLGRSALRESCLAKLPSLHRSSSGFSTLTNASVISGWRFKDNGMDVLPHKTLLRCISTDAITKKLKFSPDTVKQPLDGLRKTASRYKDAAGLQVEAFWKRNVMLLVGAAGVLACFLLWQVMYGVANLFVSFSEGMAKFGFLAMAAATVAFAAMALRARYTINPDKVYRIAMRMLNTSAAALEVLGAPLNGTDLRAYVMSSGGLRLKNLKPRIGSRRCFLIFPIQGSDRKGLVSAEVKKKKGKYDFKLLAIDIAVPEHRVFLVGDEVEYKVGGGLIGQLRDPMLKAMAAQEEFDAQDEKEEEEEAKAEEARRQQEAKDEEARRNEEIERLERENAKS